MAKRSINDTVFGIHGVNPSFSSRDDQNQTSAPKSTGKIILKRFAKLIQWSVQKYFTRPSPHRQQLLACPYLQVDEQIKLLNLQKNCIVKIANLDHLTSLVVLDLCENEIDCIQGLDNLVSLRILRLANNKWVQRDRRKDGQCESVKYDLWSLEFDKSKISIHWNCLMSWIWMEIKSVSLSLDHLGLIDGSFRSLALKIVNI